MKKKITTTFGTADALLEHWEGHRRLTRSIIDVFPENQIFIYSIGGMCSFAELAMEILRMAAPGLQAMVTGKWKTWEDKIARRPVRRTGAGIPGIFSYTLPCRQ